MVNSFLSFFFNVSCQESVFPVLFQLMYENIISGKYIQQMSPENRSRKCVQKPEPENVSCTSLPERDICVVDAGNHCLPRTSHFITVNSSLATSASLPCQCYHQVPTDPSLKCHQNHQKQMRKYLRIQLRNVPETISRTKLRKYFCSVWYLLSQKCQRMESTTVKIADGADWAKCCHCYHPPHHLSSPNSSPQMCHHYQPPHYHPILVEI